MSDFSTLVPNAPAGRFDLAQSARFLAGFTPAGRSGANSEPGALRLAFPVDGTWVHGGALVITRNPVQSSGRLPGRSGYTPKTGKTGAGRQRARKAWSS